MFSPKRHATDRLPNAVGTRPLSFREYGLASEYNMYLNLKFAPTHIYYNFKLVLISKTFIIII